MAFQFVHTYVPATGAVAIYDFLVKLKAAGPAWTVEQSGDGLMAYDGAGGTAITSAAPGSVANSLDNAGAWFVIRSADGAKPYSWAFQRKADNATWTIYRLVTGAWGGAPNATTLPTNANARLVLDNAALFAADGTYVFAAYACDATAQRSFGFYAFTTGDVTSTTRALFHEFMDTASHPGTQADNAVCYFTQNMNQTDFIGGSKVYSNFLDVTEQWAVADPFQLRSARTGIQIAPAYAGSGLGVEPSSSKDIGLPIYYGRDAGAGNLHRGFKGCGLAMRFALTNRNNLDTEALGMAKDKVWLWGLILPNDGLDPSVWG